MSDFLKPYDGILTLNYKSPVCLIWPFQTISMSERQVEGNLWQSREVLFYHQQWFWQRGMSWRVISRFSNYVMGLPTSEHSFVHLNSPNTGKILNCICLLNFVIASFFKKIIDFWMCTKIRQNNLEIIISCGQMLKTCTQHWSVTYEMSMKRNTCIAAIIQNKKHSFGLALWILLYGQ